MAKDLVVEATYVGNTEVWGAAPFADLVSANPLDNRILEHYGLSLSNPADRSLLTSLIGSPQAVQRGFSPAYPGMPPTQTVAQQLRPVPQWLAPTAYEGPAMGKTWYNSLQTKATKRFSHGLSGQASFVWSKALVDGTGAETGRFVSGIPFFNDIENFGINKQLNQLTRPLAAVISGSYTTPKFFNEKVGMKVLSQAVRDWQIGFLLRYQSGALIGSPRSNNQLSNQLARVDSTYWNYVPGANPLAVDPNCGCFNPQTTLALNKNAWTDAPAGTFGVSAPFYNNYRWQRQPAESLSLGRNFRMGKEGRYNLSIRAEFQNIFNRLFLSAPVSSSAQGGALTPSNGSNPATVTTTSGGVITAGYGAIATIGGAGASPRSGQIVGRFTF